MITVQEIKKLVAEDQVIIGKERTLKALKLKKVKEVLYASNTPEETASDLAHYGNIASIPITKLPVPNDELGTACKKPFAISILGIKG